MHVVRAAAPEWQLSKARLSGLRTVVEVSEVADSREPELLHGVRQEFLNTYVYDPWSTLILRVLVNHRISNLLSVETVGVSVCEFAPGNLTWVIFFFF